MKYFAKIKYLGTNFCGFQVQPLKRTVQGELTKACEQLFGARTFITGCSRTDSGVHANEFCLTVECDAATVPPEKLPLALSRFLPNDISLYFAEECSADFHPRYSVRSKEYLYRIKLSRISDPFEFGRAWILPADFSKNQISLMKNAAEYFVGEYDFKAFMSEGSDVADTVRRVDYLNIAQEDDHIDIRISANGFLYNMVRIIVGTLVDVAFGRILPHDVPDIISSRDRARAGMTAPPQGLYLNKVNY